MPRVLAAFALLPLLLTPALVPDSFATTWRVPGEFPTIQPAIDQAAPGDTVLVAPGTYMGPLNRDLEFHGEEIVVRSESGPEATTIWRNRAADGGGMRVQYGTVVVQGCTFAQNYAPLGSGIYSTHQYGLTLGHTIIAFGLEGAALAIEIPYGDHRLSCCDLFGHAGGDWTGPIADHLDMNGNFSLDPLFCDLANEVLRLDAMSPCLDAPGCGLIGAWGKGCGTHTGVAGTRSQLVTWGALKDRAGRGE